MGIHAATEDDWQSKYRCVGETLVRNVAAGELE